MITADILPDTDDKLLVYYEAYIRPDLRKRRVGISGATVRAWIMLKHSLDFDEAQRIQVVIRDSRPGQYFEREAPDA